MAVVAGSLDAGLQALCVLEPVLSDRYAGARVWSTSDDTFYANENFAMIHTATAGRKQIKLPRPRDVYDVLSGARVGRAVTSIELEIPDKTTRVFRLSQPPK